VERVRFVTYTPKYYLWRLGCRLDALQATNPTRARVLVDGKHNHPGRAGNVFDGRRRRAADATCGHGRAPATPAESPPDGPSGGCTHRTGANSILHSGRTHPPKTELGHWGRTSPRAGQRFKDKPREKRSRESQGPIDDAVTPTQEFHSLIKRKQNRPTGFFQPGPDSFAVRHVDHFSPPVWTSLSAGAPARHSRCRAG